jgi:hypothetical protein
MGGRCHGGLEPPASPPGSVCASCSKVRQRDLGRQPAVGGVAFDVRRALIPRVASADTRIETVARALAVSVRSLQRRLSEEGQSYQTVVDATRRDRGGATWPIRRSRLRRLGF